MSENLHKVTKSSEIAFDGASFDIETVDGQIKSVTVVNQQGHKVKIAADSAYSDLRVLVPAAPKKVKKYSLFISLNGVSEIREIFNDKYEAEARLAAIEKEFDFPAFTNEIKEVEVDEE